MIAAVRSNIYFNILSLYNVEVRVKRSVEAYTNLLWKQKRKWPFNESITWTKFQLTFSDRPCGSTRTTEKASCKNLYHSILRSI